MTHTCPNCGRIGIIKRKDSLEIWHCPWLDCKYEGNGPKKYEPILDKLKYGNVVSYEHLESAQNNGCLPKMSCIIPFAKSLDPQRDNALKLLFDCFHNQTFQDFEIIVVEHRRDNSWGSFPYLVDKHIVVVDNRPFNKAWCCNVGAKVAKTENLVFHDADVLFGQDYLQKVYDFSAYHDLFSGWSSFRCMPGKDNPYLRIHVPKTIHCLVGAWYARKSFFWNTFGGWNEDYFGYGREDSDTWHRARYVCGGKVANLDYSLVHYYHNWHPPNGPNPLNLNDDRGNAILKTCMNTPEEIVKKLLAVKDRLGNPDHPTPLFGENYGKD